MGFLSYMKRYFEYMNVLDSSLVTFISYQILSGLCALAYGSQIIYVFVCGTGIQVIPDGSLVVYFNKVCICGVKWFSGHTHRVRRLSRPLNDPPYTYSIRFPDRSLRKTRNISNRLESNLPLYYPLSFSQTRCILRFLIGCPRQDQTNSVGCRRQRWMCVLTVATRS